MVNSDVHLVTSCVHCNFFCSVWIHLHVRPFEQPTHLLKAKRVLMFVATEEKTFLQLDLYLDMIPLRKGSTVDPTSFHCLSVQA